MTLEERVKSIVGKKIAIWCETKDEARELVDYLNKITKEDTGTFWDCHRDTCYSLDSVNELWCYGSKEWYEENNYTIIPFKNFINNYNNIINDDTLVTLSFNDIIELLNTTYGKDKWVIK